MRCSLLCVTLAALGFSLFGSSLTLADDLFPDKVLESAVRKHVFEKRNNKEPLTEKDVENISTVSYKGFTFTLDGKRVERKEKIKDLRGLEKCRSLRELDLEENEITDLTPIKDLKEIQSLTLAHNKITDIKPLEGLVKLQYLQLEYNQVKDISVVAKMENMKSLYLTNNQITDISPVANLTKMWSLYLGGNKIKDLSPIAKLKFLDTIGLEGNGLKDITPLSNLAPSRFLFLQDNELENLNVLIQMAKKDSEEKDPAKRRYFPLFWNVYLNGNPLNDEAKTKQLAELKKYSNPERIFFD